jgi:hypothetical protein
MREPPIIVVCPLKLILPGCELPCGLLLSFITGPLFSLTGVLVTRLTGMLFLNVDLVVLTGGDAAAIDAVFTGPL